jgi:hypothetical protein
VEIEWLTALSTEQPSAARFRIGWQMAEHKSSCYMSGAGHEENYLLGQNALQEVKGIISQQRVPVKIAPITTSNK